MSEGQKETASDVIRRYYYNPSTGYLSPYKLFKRIQEAGYNISEQRVRQWVQQQSAQQVTTLPKPPPVFNTIVAPYPGYNYQMDTMFMTSQPHNGFQYILLIIDVNSRYLGGAAMKQKNAYINKFGEIIDDWFVRPQNRAPVWPKVLTCDNEYRSTEFVHMMRSREVEVRYSQPDQPHKNAIVERVIRTLRQWLGRWRFQTDDTDWVTALPTIIRNYNTTFHTTLRTTPLAVWTLQDVNHQPVRKFVIPKHKKGERVRVVLRTHNTAFQKSGERKLSSRVYIVVGHEKGEVFKWIIKDEETDELVRDARGQPKRYLDYELVTVHEVEGRQVEGPNVREERRLARVSRTVQRDTRGAHAVPFTEIGVPIPGRELTVAPVELEPHLQPAQLKRVSKPVVRY